MKAIHEPDIDWLICNDNPVFIGNGGDGGLEEAGDLSADPIQHVLP
jgi:carboxypeptidase D